MALLLYSRKCKFCNEIISFIKENKPLHTVVSFHDVNISGVPPELRSKVTSVPTMVTKDGNIMVGKEAKEWLASMIPNEFTGAYSSSSVGMQNFADPDASDGSMFSLDNYGASLKPPMTRELQEKIDKDVSDAYNSRNN